jgi:hypothetical protein
LLGLVAGARGVMVGRGLKKKLAPAGGLPGLLTEMAIGVWGGIAKSDGARIARRGRAPV